MVTLHPWAQFIYRQLAEQNLRHSIAFLIDQNTIYFATHPHTEHLISPHSALTRLIQGVYDHSPLSARRIIRNRIYTDLKPHSVMNFGMTRVAAKRVTYEVDQIQEERDVELPELQWVNLTFWMNSTSGFRQDPYRELIHEWNQKNLGWRKMEYFSLLKTLKESIPRGSNRYESARPVSCLLVQNTPEMSQGKILALALNTNHLNRTLHAEVNLIQSYFHSIGELLPAYSVIYTTLKPCRMCASMIWECASDRSKLRVIYAENDPGPHAKDTILSASTRDRAQFCTHPLERELQIEEIAH